MITCHSVGEPFLVAPRLWAYETTGARLRPALWLRNACQQNQNSASKINVSPVEEDQIRIPEFVHI